MAKQQNSVSEKFILRLRHSRKSQLASVLVFALGLIGIYLVVTAFAPVNYGENLDRKTLDSRGDSLRERVGLRVNDTFSRLNFIVSRKKDNPEWIQPVNLPAPPEEVKLTLPDSSLFGDVNTQSAAAEESDAPDQANQSEKPTTPQNQSIAPAQSPAPSNDKTPVAQTPAPSASELGLGSSCAYEQEAE